MHLTKLSIINCFNRLRDRSMYLIVLRLLINMYIEKKIQVKWNDNIIQAI